MTTTMNRLPVATWNPLGVNYAPASAALPTVPADGWAKAEILSPALPAGVTARAEADFGDFAASGMGAETDTWLAENANLVNHLAVSGTADAPIVFENTLDAAHPHALTYLTIDAAEGSSLTVVQVVRGDAENGVSASLTRIRAAENAHVTLGRRGQGVHRCDRCHLRHRRGRRHHHRRPFAGGCAGPWR